MRLREIDKTRYRKTLRVIITGMIAALMILSLSVSTLLIRLFSTPQAPHFWFNLAGVAAAALSIIIALLKFRTHPFMTEVAYVWDLKQQLNRIYRKQRKIEADVENDDHNAMIIMRFMYRGSKQLYELDDNTITMEGLNNKIKLLDKRMAAAGLDLSTDSYRPAMLDQFQTPVI
ncbi:MAG: DUF3087 family protein [Gammaproteobacteria bacterium]|nr:DUF3087 family protein [Gammaproteobacteria bacterium]